MALAKLSELLSSVKDNSYAIGSFNVSNMEMAMGAIKAAEKNASSYYHSDCRRKT